MMTVWRYKLEWRDNEQIIMMPSKARILHVETREGVPSMWVLVEADNTTEFRTFKFLDTGQWIKDWEGTYLGTFVVPNALSKGDYVGHVFEVSK